MALVLLIPGLFGIQPYVVYSGSMEPEIPTGAVVFTKEGEFSPKKGDIITFHNGDTVVTHRVVKKEKFVYLEVSVPVRNVITVAKDGTRNALAKTELFSFTKNKDWTQLERTEVGQNMVYTYAYNHILKPGTKTTTLFDTVTFANIIEGQLDTQQIDMPVRAYAIQATNTGDDKTTVLEQATAAYQKYVNQNKGQAGGVTK